MGKILAYIGLAVIVIAVSVIIIYAGSMVTNPATQIFIYFIGGGISALLYDRLYDKIIK